MKLFLFAIFVAGCSTVPGTYVPPVTLGAGVFGFDVTVGLGGYTVPAKVIPSKDVKEPTVLVPASAPVTEGAVPVTTASGITTTVPVKVASVTKPVLALPK